jgi:hypothetical protein
VALILVKLALGCGAALAAGLALRDAVASEIVTPRAF